MVVRAKICGVTNSADAALAIRAGADALGFVFVRKSPRCVEPAVAAGVTVAMPPFVSRVGLFVDAPEEEVWRTVEACGLDTVQFHGDEAPEYCGRFTGRVRVIKAFRIRDEGSLEALPRYPMAAWLLDSFVEGQAGGTGRRFNWELARRANLLGRPIILAGGLTPDNVGEAIRSVAPYAVDVSSGVESGPGRKDPARLASFLACVRGPGV